MNLCNLLVTVSSYEYIQRRVLRPVTCAKQEGHETSAGSNAIRKSVKLPGADSKTSCGELLIGCPLFSFILILDSFSNLTEVW